MAQPLSTDSSIPSQPGDAVRSKTVAAWLALVLGSLGMHRIYLYGAGDKLAWAHVPLTAAGLVGLERFNALGQDDRLAWILLPVLGLMLSQAALVAILYALMPDARWDARFHGGRALSRTGWATVLAAVAALVFGGGMLIATIAYSTQKLFEWQLESSSTARTPR